MLAAMQAVDITPQVGGEPLEAQAWAQKRRAVRMGWGLVGERDKAALGWGEKCHPKQERAELAGWWRRAW